MAEESFEDETVAELLNRHFIPVKVDREVRPDVDEIYMSVCQMVTGQGGWPLTIIMTPEQEPFFAGTYFPRERRFGMPGLTEILEKVSSAWEKDREALKETGRRMAALLEEQGPAPAWGTAQDPEKESGSQFKRLEKMALDQLEQSFDRRHGGFGSAPKFPNPSGLLYLLYESHFSGNDKALRMAEKTLDQMYRGGIFDHVGFGFCRYSTDEKWLVPHFEKMLYDNAQLALTYSTAWQITGKPIYREVARKTLDYMLRELSADCGAFYSAQDADSQGREGAFYVFTPGEMEGILGKEEADYFNQYFDITEKGNFEGSNIPNLIENQEFADPAHGASADGINHRAQWLLQQAYTYRLSRMELKLDQKILTAWNALAALAMVRAYRSLASEIYLNAAANVLSFIRQRLWDKKQGLFLGGAYPKELGIQEGNAGRVSAEAGKEPGKTANSAPEFVRFGPGLLEDYSYLIWAVLEMYQATLEIRWLAWAVELCQTMQKEFWDKESGGFYMTAASGESLISRPKPTFDAVMPSGNAVAAYDLLLLSRLTARTEYDELLQRQLDFLAEKAAAYPAGHPFALLTFLLAESPARSLVCTLPEPEGGRTEPDDRQRLQALLNYRFLPDLVVLAKTSINAELLGRLAPFSRNYPLEKGRPGFYLCQNRYCQAPCHSIQELARELTPQEDRGGGPKGTAEEK
ncbi:MAG: thioredoxin domain-containing protein [Peptococcaceae bacterium]|nr:thioredoxin domain-containing protein [Peptococcaceae bacterium]